MRIEQPTLLAPTADPLETIYVDPAETLGTSAIEDSTFPFEHISKIAEMESWRKEVHRPIYHLHKWWAQRLGSVFRAIAIGTFASSKSDVLQLFSQPTRVADKVVFDPFMGSGTTIGETLKLRGRAIGRDINPVAFFLVRNALGIPKRDRLIKTFASIENDVSPILKKLYETKLGNGASGTVLYYFWVKYTHCPKCKNAVDLFSSYIFSRHAYPKRFPEARALCPKCGELNQVRYNSRNVVCEHCTFSFDAALGPARGAHATCVYCENRFSIAATIRQGNEPPAHRMYAKLVLTPSGKKQYMRADQADIDLYERAVSELNKRGNAFPLAEIAPGHNTDQVLNYCYRTWSQMFNPRQLLSLSILANRIKEIPDERERELFCCLFSGVLEFNNMFASFKGEGTGAVRHMFAHHILKPERTPLEANVWGTPKSSGSFSTLFQSRILRALEYCEDPFEIIVEPGKNGRQAAKKVFGLSDPLHYEIATDFQSFKHGKRLYLSCGDSRTTDIPSSTVDAVITDPPFFDNVNYSQLADFFFVWQQYILAPAASKDLKSTRSEAEVQCGNSSIFAARLEGIWRECNRVLKQEGLLVFTYHHSRNEGWVSVLLSLMRAGFRIVRAHPIKSEMSVATPKHQAKEPIDLDIIMVCRKQTGSVGRGSRSADILASALEESHSQIERFVRVGRRLSRNDVRVIITSQIITVVSGCGTVDNAQIVFDELEPEIEKSIQSLHDRFSAQKTTSASA